MMKALAAMRGPLSFTAVEFSKCQHQTVVDLVDLVGMESPGDRANKAIQVVPDPVFRVAKTTRGLLARVGMTTARHVPGGMMIALGSVVMMTVHLVPGGMMIARFVGVVTMLVRRGLVVMMIVLGSVVMMTVRLVLVGMMIARFVGVVTMLVHRGLVVMMIVLGSVATTTARLVPVVMTDSLAHVQLPSRRPMRFAIGVAVAA